MNVEASSPNCPYCGGPLRLNDSECEHCGREIIITTFNSIKKMTQLELNKKVSTCKKELANNPDDIQTNKEIAYSYFCLNMYDDALKHFEKAIVDNFDDSEVYFYAAICRLKGKKAFLAMRPDIDKIEELLRAATMIESKGIYYYFWAYIKQDYFKRKFLVTSPDYMQMLNTAKQYGYTSADVQNLFADLKVDNPFMG